MRGSGLLADAPTMDRLQILILFAKARKYKGTEKLPLKKWVFSVPLCLQMPDLYKLYRRYMF